MSLLLSVCLSAYVWKFFMCCVVLERLSLWGTAGVFDTQSGYFAGPHFWRFGNVLLAVLTWIIIQKCVSVCVQVCGRATSRISNPRLSHTVLQLWLIQGGGWDSQGLMAGNEHVHTHRHTYMHTNPYICSLYGKVSRYGLIIPSFAGRLWPCAGEPSFFYWNVVSKFFAFVCSWFTFL